MIEKPILFSTDMVRAILAGKKTQTRRVIKGVPGWMASVTCRNDVFSISGYPPLGGIETVLKKCPYGKPGDSLWVRETWSCIGAEHIRPSLIPPDYHVNYRAIKKDWLVDKWRPSIFMPRWASRITLDVIKVGVERVQDITVEQVRKEGVEVEPQFVKLWDSINAKRGYPWDSNPWVWVVEFKVRSNKEVMPKAL